MKLPRTMSQREKFERVEQVIEVVSQTLIVHRPSHHVDCNSLLDWSKTCIRNCCWRSLRTWSQRWSEEKADYCSTVTDYAKSHIP